MPDVQVLARTAYSNVGQGPLLRPKDAALYRGCPRSTLTNAGRSRMRFLKELILLGGVHRARVKALNSDSDFILKARAVIAQIRATQQSLEKLL